MRGSSFKTNLGSFTFIKNQFYFCNMNNVLGENVFQGLIHWD